MWIQKRSYREESTDSKSLENELGILDMNLSGICTLENVSRNLNRLIYIQSSYISTTLRAGGVLPYCCHEERCKLLLAPKARIANWECHLLGRQLRHVQWHQRHVPLLVGPDSMQEPHSALEHHFDGQGASRHIHLYYTVPAVEHLTILGHLPYERWEFLHIHLSVT